MSDDGGSWAPFGPSGDDDPSPKPAPVPAEEPVEDPGPPPEPIELPRRDPEPDDLPPAAAFEPPAPPPLEPLPGPEPAAPLAWPSPQEQPSPPPVGTWPPPGPPAYGAPARIPGNATASLILGIVGVVFCPIIASIPAITLGYSAKREIRANPGLGGDGMASWGIGLGYLGLAFGVLIVLLAVAGTISVTND
jgi:hypothetical protein